jgi:hypothetical protein
MLVVLQGSGLASADAISGQTYADASAYLSEMGSEVVIATVVGDQLERDKCVVTHWQLNSSNKDEALVYLNCNATVATAGDAGNSVSTPEGQQAKLDAKRAANITKDSSFCEKSDDVTDWCISLCERTELCTYTGS